MLFCSAIHQHLNEKRTAFYLEHRAEEGVGGVQPAGLPFFTKIAARVFLTFKLRAP
jgi:hypothetical protein